LSTLNKDRQPRRRRRKISKDDILATATTLFAERGYAALSMRDIAAACKVNIPSIYHFFGGKENLYDTCCNTAFAASARKIHASMDNIADTESRIRHFVIAVSEVLLEHQEVRRLLLHELIIGDESRHYEELTMHAFVKEFRMLVAEISKLEGVANAGELAFAIYSLTLGFVLLRRNAEVAHVDPSLTLTPVRLAEQVLSTVLPHWHWGGERKDGRAPRRNRLHKDLSS
jgi:TetR/AcrR family transcriptional regulator